MGQLVVALMYGVRASELSELRDDDGEWPWQSLPWADQPRDADEGDCIGFSVAVSGGGDDGEGDLGETCAVKDIAKCHAEGIEAAKEKWQAFAKWFKANCKAKLSKAELWLTTDERA